MRVTRIVAWTVFLILTGVSISIGGELDPLKLLYDCREACKKIKTYSGTFTKREFLRGKLRKTEVMLLKFRQEPLSIYAKWTGKVHKGREVIYVKGKNKNKIIGHDFVGPLNVTLKMAVHSSEARKSSRRPITDGGMLNSIRAFIRYVEMGKQNNDIRLRYVGTEALNGRPSHLIVRILEKREDYPAHITFLYIDKDWLLPTKCVGYDWDYKLLWVYTTVEIKLNAPLTDKDFDPKNKEYKYPALFGFRMPKLF